VLSHNDELVHWTTREASTDAGQLICIN